MGCRCAWPATGSESRHCCRSPHEAVARSLGCIQTNPRRRSRIVRPNSSPASRGWSPTVRLVAGLLLVLAVTVTTACGTNKQTLRPYTPAEGVNFDVGGERGVKVRNLMILSRAEGEGILSATMVAADRAQLTAVSGKAIKSDGTDGAPLSATIPSSVSLGNGVLVVLTDGPFITVRSPDLKAGLVADVTLQFSTAGSATVRVPVIDGNEGPYATISPEATPSAG